MNGYFQVGCTPNGTILKVFKPTDGGEPVDAKEITEYLTNRGILYTASAIGQGIEEMEKSGKPDHLILLNKDQIREIEESYLLRSTPDKMTLTARFYPPSMKGRMLSPEEFKNDLTHKGVKNGIKDDAIAQFFAKPEFCKDVVVAEGTPVVQGKHAEINYYFNTDLSTKPALNPDGSVDFFHLNTYSTCRAGDLLAELIPEEPGTPGMDIFGEPIRPLDVKKRVLKFGRNIELSEDKRKLTAQVNGQVSLVDDKVFLNNVMELDNVGTATGNINFEGSVLVLGNVNENFSVKAEGSIEVRGIVEGAKLEAGENITIARGISGMGKGVLKAGGNIISKYIDGVPEVTAGGFVQTELILHSNVSAGTEVNVSGRKGFIAGGRVAAANLISVKTLGSDMGADTTVEVGADPSVKVRMAEIQKKIAEDKKTIEQNKPSIETFTQKMKSGVQLSMDQKMYFKTLLTEQKEKETELQELLAEYEELSGVFDSTTNARIEVRGDVYAGTKICISDVSMTVKNTMTYCQFKKEHGEVKMTSL